VNDALKETMLFTEYLQKRILVEQNYASALAALEPFTINDKAPNTSLRHGLTMLNDSTQTTVQAHRAFSKQLDEEILQKLLKFNNAGTSILQTSMSALKKSLGTLEKESQLLESAKRTYIESSQQSLLAADLDVPDVELGGFPESLLTQTLIAADKALRKYDVPGIFLNRSIQALKETDLADHFSTVLSLDNEKALELIETLVQHHFVQRHSKRTFSNTFLRDRSGEKEQFLTFNKFNPLPHETVKTPAHILRVSSWAKHEYDSVIMSIEQHRLNYEREMTHHAEILEQLCKISMEKLKDSFSELHSHFDTLKPAVQRSQELVTVAAESMQPDTDLVILLDLHRVGGKHVPTFLKEDLITKKDDGEATMVTYKDQVFGVPLQEHLSYTRMSVPYVVNQAIKCIEQHLSQLPQEHNVSHFFSAWTSAPNYQELHHLRHVMNIPLRPFNNSTEVPDKTVELSERFELLLWTNLLKLYFLELPDSLCPSSFYQQIKRVYTATSTATTPVSPVDPSNGILNHALQLRQVFAQLPPPNYHSLKAVLQHLANYYEHVKWNSSPSLSIKSEHKDTSAVVLNSADGNQSPQVQESTSPSTPIVISSATEYLQKLAASLGPILLRAPQETPISFHDRHPLLFLQTCISEFTVIFGDFDPSWNNAIAVSQAPTSTTVDEANPAHVVSSTPIIAPENASHSSTSSEFVFSSSTAEFVDQDSESFSAMFMGEDISEDDNLSDPTVECKSNEKSVTQPHRPSPLRTSSTEDPDSSPQGNKDDIVSDDAMSATLHSLRRESTQAILNELDNMMINTQVE
jgi:hypothetical protein